MSASESLNETLFHGTSGRFKPGDIILPASKAGVKQNWGAKSKNDPNLAYATDSLDSAKYYADVSKLWNESPTARSRVYRVEPVNTESAKWTETKFREGTLRQHVSSEGYRVLGRAWIRPKNQS